MKAYEVEVTVKNAQPPKNVRAPIKLVYVIKAESEINAKTEALNSARRTQTAHPRIYRNATFACETPCIREAFSKDELH